MLSSLIDSVYDKKIRVKSLINSNLRKIIVKNFD